MARSFPAVPRIGESVSDVRGIPYEVTVVDWGQGRNVGEEFIEDCEVMIVVREGSGWGRSR